MQVQSIINRACALLFCLPIAACVTQPTRPAAVAGPAAGASTAPSCERLPTLSNSQKVAVGSTIGGFLGGIVGSTLGNRQDRHVVTGVLGGALVGALAGSALKNEIDIEEQADGSVRLRVPGSLMFATGQYQLSPTFQSTLNSVTQTIKKYCDVQVRVVGHTDNIGQAKYNQVLSEKRALAVQNHMLSMGLDQLRISAEGRGDSQPRASNTDEQGRQQNRRVEIFAQVPSS